MGYFDESPSVEDARKLQSLLIAHRGDAELSARIAPPVHRAMAEAGMFRVMAPVEAGGLELDYPHVLATIEEIAVGDITASWYVVNSSPIGIRSAFLSAAKRDLVMTPSDAHFAFSGLPVGTATPVDGGYELSGEWPIVTGCEGSEWAHLGGTVTNQNPDGPPDIRFFIVETTKLKILDGWQHVAGMRGTGSNGVVADKVFVAEDLSLSPATPIVLDRPLFRISLFLHAAATSAAAILGAWRSGLESVVSSISTYRSAVDGRSPSEDEFNQELVARSDAAFRASRAGFASAADEIWDALQRDGAVPIDVRARMFATVTYTIDTAREEISRLYAASSRATFERNHPAEQALRNIHAFANPIDRFRRFAVDAGGVMLDREPRSPVF